MTLDIFKIFFLHQKSFHGQDDFNFVPKLFPLREEDPGWVWSRGTHILSADK